MQSMSRVWTRSSLAVVALATALLAVSCGSADKVPAEAAIKSAETAIAAVRTEAEKYVPDQLRSVESGLQTAKASFDKGEYKAALTGAQDLTAKVKDLGTAAAAKKDELTKTWEDMSGGLPKMAEAIQSRVDILSKSKKLPAGLDKDKFEGAKAGLATLNQTWTEASDAFKAGNLTDAVTKAKAAKDKAVEVMTALSMQVPSAAK